MQGVRYRPKASWLCVASVCLAVIFVIAFEAQLQLLSRVETRHKAAKPDNMSRINIKTKHEAEKPGNISRIKTPLEAAKPRNMSRQSDPTLKKRAEQQAKRGKSTNVAENPEEDKYDLDVYPVNGTGVSVDISEEFDTGVFNSFCDTRNNLTAVLSVYSTVDNFKLRDILRRTLGRWAEKLNCKMFFITGVSLNQTVHRIIQKEYVQKKDILVMPKIDAYRDLNDKAVTMIDWLSRYCMHVPYVIHLIDDAYVNLEMFMDRLKSIKKDTYMLGGLNILPDKSFPKYLIGFAYAFPTRIAGRLLSAVHTARYCWIEDVWFTGTVRQEAGVEMLHIQRSEWLSGQNKPFGKRLDGLPSYFMIHPVESELFPKLYSTVID